ncbi:unnamed protein product [Effrenium voratum]|uniref:Uncharacterized protein n=1 Tax=Effrenium voratum TaxID=2562239 RepID=A0AA36NE42_9DINO|nr:unnamed protein product [Effrenium voratum]CAJ1443268.1 unnamed protein product [Effrenium voratum]
MRYVGPHVLVAGRRRCSGLGSGHVAACCGTTAALSRCSGSLLRWRWEKVPEGWKVWAEADTGETMVLTRNLKNSLPQFQLRGSCHLAVSWISWAEEVVNLKRKTAELQQQCSHLAQQLSDISRQRHQPPEGSGEAGFAAAA